MAELSDRLRCDLRRSWRDLGPWRGAEAAALQFLMVCGRMDGAQQADFVWEIGSPLLLLGWVALCTCAVLVEICYTVILS